MERRLKEIEGNINEGDEDDAELHREEKKMLESLLKAFNTTS